MWNIKLTEDVLLPTRDPKSHEADPGIDDGEHRRKHPAERTWLGHWWGLGNKLIGFGPCLVYKTVTQTWDWPIPNSG